MAIVYIGIVETTTDFQLEEAWQTKHLERCFGNEEAAKNWIDEHRIAHHNGNDGFSDQEDTYERWSKGESYCRFYEVKGRPFKIEYYYLDMEIEE